jgi:hypothetical protein
MPHTGLVIPKASLSTYTTSALTSTPIHTIAKCQSIQNNVYATPDNTKAGKLKEMIIHKKDTSSTHDTSTNIYLFIFLALFNFFLSTLYKKQLSASGVAMDFCNIEMVT